MYHVYVYVYAIYTVWRSSVCMQQAQRRRVIAAVSFCNIPYMRATHYMYVFIYVYVYVY
jgi:hypothetical protein